MIADETDGSLIISPSRAVRALRQSGLTHFDHTPVRFPADDN